MRLLLKAGADPTVINALGVTFQASSRANLRMLSASTKIDLARVRRLLARRGLEQ